MAHQSNDSSTLGLMPGSFIDSDQGSPTSTPLTPPARPRKIYTNSPYPNAPSLEGSYSRTSSTQRCTPRPSSRNRSVSRGRRSRRSTSPACHNDRAGTSKNGNTTTFSSQRIQILEHSVTPTHSTEKKVSYKSPAQCSISFGRQKQHVATNGRVRFAGAVEQHCHTPIPSTMKDISGDDHPEHDDVTVPVNGPPKPREDIQTKRKRSSADIRETCSVLGELHSICERKQEERDVKMQGNTKHEEINRYAEAEFVNQDNESTSRAQSNPESAEILSYHTTFEQPATASYSRSRTMIKVDEDACFSDSDIEETPSKPIPIPLSSDCRLLRARQYCGSPLFEKYTIQKYNEVCKLRNIPKHLRRSRACRRTSRSVDHHMDQLVRKVQLSMPGSRHVTIPARQAQAIRNEATLNRNVDFLAPFSAVRGPAHGRRLASPAGESVFALS